MVLINMILINRQITLGVCQSNSINSCSDAKMSKFIIEITHLCSLGLNV